LPLPMQDSLPAGWLAFTGRELNPLDRDERFPSCYISSPLPGLFLTLRHSIIDDLPALTVRLLRGSRAEIARMRQSVKQANLQLDRSLEAAKESAVLLRRLRLQGF
jgi:hypothetical protein